MLLSELLGATVECEGARIGHVIDVRLVADDAGPHTSAAPRLHLHGLVVSPHARTSTLGYERTGLRSPWPIAAFERWTHRGAFLVPWADIRAIRGDRIDLRPRHRRYAPTLRDNLARANRDDEREH